MLFFRKKKEQNTSVSWMIAGLGNPELKYEGSRHNAGFAVIDYLTEKYEVPYGGTKMEAAIGRGKIKDEDVLFVRPVTYMNRSGDAIEKLTRFYKVDSRKRLIVLVDDIHLPVGALRIREKGSAGGHNGLKSIIERLGHDEFIRIRIGVGEPARGGSDQIRHVLSKVSKEDQPVLDGAVRDAGDAAAMIVTDGTTAAMNRYNRKKE